MNKTADIEFQYNRILRRKEVLNRLGIGSTTLHHMMKKGVLPEPFMINERSVGWLEKDIEAFIASRVANGQAMKGV